MNAGRRRNTGFGALRSDRSELWRNVAIWAVGSAAALFAAWVSLPIPLARLNPFLGYQLAPSSGTINAARAALLITIPTTKPAEVAAVDRRALLAEPMNFDAASNLGLIRFVSGERDAALKLFALVGRANLRNKDSHAMLLQHALDRNDGKSAVREAEILLRQRQSLEATALRVLVIMVDRGSITEALADRLSQNVPWRAQLIGAIGQDGQNPDRELELFRAMRARGNGPTAAELDLWLLRLSASRTPQDVARLWQEFGGSSKPGPERYLRGGDMEISNAPRPFNWTLYTGDDGYAERESAPHGDRKAMLVEYRGGDAMTLAGQWLVLQPGNYRFSVRISAPTTATQTTISAALNCVRSERVIAKLPLLAKTADTWQTVAADLIVPADCPVQSLSIIADGSPDGGYQQLFLDDFTLAPLATAQTKQ